MGRANFTVAAPNEEPPNKINTSGYDGFITNNTATDELIQYAAITGGIPIHPFPHKSLAPG